MGVLVALFFVCAAGLLARPVSASEWVRSTPTFHEEAAEGWQGLKQHLEDWASRLRNHLDLSPARGEKQLITFMLEHRQKLGLGPQQVQQLDKIRTDFRRQAIRSEADLKVAEMDLDILLKTDPVDMKRAEAKIREIEKINSDLRLARIRAIEEGKALLSREQRAKLKDILAEPKREQARSD
jgi:Spy/CpxP family protein refolding chaperone